MPTPSPRAAAGAPAAARSASSKPSANRLTSATLAGATETYAYDGDWVRVSRQIGAGPITRYVTDPAAGLPVTIDDDTRRYVWGQGLAYAVNGSSIEVYHTDRLGSVRAITDATGAVSATYRTDEFGLPTATTGTSSQPFTFTGEPRDATGLTYLRARSYDPSLGRFMSRDPFAGFASTPLSLNRYSYVENNPATWSDPSGLSPSSKVLSCGGDAHGLLDVTGLVFPPSDIANAGIYLCEGDPGNAALSGIAFVPTIGDLLKWLGKSLRIGSKAFVIGERQLQRKFKHATDFGITGPWNKTSGQAFREAIEQHVRNTPGSAGTFRGQSGTWHLDSNTGVGVFVDEAGNFATGFKLSAEQLLHFPRIGGG